MKIKPAQTPGGVTIEPGPKENQLLPLVEEGATKTLHVFRLKKILVPVDFTTCAEKALLYAVPFARQFQAELTLLHVVEIPFSIGFEAGAPFEMETEDEARKELQLLRERSAIDVACQTMVRTGTPAQEIVAAAKELGSDLIILATHGRRGMERVLLGSTAEKIVRQAHCPLLIVREPEHEFIVDQEAPCPEIAN